MTPINWRREELIEAYDNMAWGEILDQIFRKVMSND